MMPHRIFPVPSSQHAAFSLVELVVVSAMLSIVAALSLSALNHFRKSAQGIECAGNLRQIGAATLAYAADNGGKLPGPLSGSQRSEVASSYVLPANRVSLVDFLAPYLGMVQLPASPIDAPPFICPAARAQLKSEKPNVTSGFYYVHVITWNNAALQQLPLGYRATTGSKQPLRVQGIQHPASTVLLVEQDAHLMASRGIATPGSPSQPAHDRQRNVLFTDGHVESVRIERFHWQMSTASLEIR